MTTPQTLATAARDAVRLASIVTRDVQRRLDEVRAITKDDNSPVTIADLAAQAIVAHALRASTGSGAMVGEEDTDYLRNPANSAALEKTLEAARAAWPTVTKRELLDAIDMGDGEPRPEGFWTLDPIDGTKGFLRGQQYAISLAWIEHGRPIAGALACPNLDIDHAHDLDAPSPEGSCYWAWQGGGLHEAPCLPESAADDRTRHVPPAMHNAKTITICASVEKAHSSVSDTDRVLEHLESRGFVITPPRRLDSQAKYAVVGRGQADAYLRLPARKGYEEKIWDHAAGAIIATEGGAITTDIHGRPLDFSQGHTLRNNKGVVCAAPHAHKAIIDAIAALGVPNPH